MIGIDLLLVKSWHNILSSNAFVLAPKSKEHDLIICSEVIAKISKGMTSTETSFSDRKMDTTTNLLVTIIGTLQNKNSHIWSLIHRLIVLIYLSPRSMCPSE